MRIRPTRVYLPPELKAAARVFAKETNRSMSNLLVHALSTLLSKNHAWQAREHREPREGGKRKEGLMRVRASVSKEES